MADTSKGWICLYRSIQDHWIWEDKPFSRGQAWMDLCMLANRENKKFPFGDEIVEVNPGTVITSELKLMERWGWSKKKLRSFLKLLEKDGMIVKETNRKRTTINIVNFERLSVLGTNKRPIRDQSETNKEPKGDTNNNNNNKNNYNNYFKGKKNQFQNFQQRENIVEIEEVEKLLLKKQAGG